MRKLSRKVRLENAIKEVEAHVRKFGIADIQDWGYSFAVHWGFEEDEAVVEQLIAHMQSVDQHIKDEKQRVKQAKMNARRPTPVPDDWPYRKS
jgi:hypothetical protein